MISMVKSLTDKNFVEETKDGVVLVDFWATWCGPCRMQGPVIDQLDEEMGDKVTFTKVDVDENPETARAFGIMSIPTLLIKKDGEECYSISYTSDTPRFLHVAMLKELWKRSESGKLYTYHFAMLRNVLERAASFHGYSNIEECFKNEDISNESNLYNRMINILTHGNYSLYEPIEMLDDNKELFKQILTAFTKNYKFNPEIFASSEA